MFQLAPKGRISQHDIIRQAIPQLGGGDWEGSTADCRQSNNWKIRSGDSNVDGGLQVQLEKI